MSHVFFVAGHWCSCFPGAVGYEDYMCTYPDDETPEFQSSINGFEFDMYIEQYKAVPQVPPQPSSPHSFPVQSGIHISSIVNKISSS